MFQIRVHGRGGQGVVTATEMLSVAAFEEGRYAQAAPRRFRTYCRASGGFSANPPVSD
ncbi:MAG: hypothetical protein R8K48_04835 [Gallionella sp.]